MALIQCPECSTEVSENAAECIKCGYPIRDIVKCPDCGTYNAGKPAACVRCGAPLKKPTAVAAAAAAPASPARHSAYSDFDDEEPRPVSDTWVWMLAFVPIIGAVLEWIVYAAVGYNGFVGYIIFLVLNILFTALDNSELKEKGHQPEGWMWLGFFLVPVYLFMRASKTNKQYGYAIVWCVLLVLYVCIDVALDADMYDIYDW